MMADVGIIGSERWVHCGFSGSMNSQMCCAVACDLASAIHGTQSSGEFKVTASLLIVMMVVTLLSFP